MLKTFESFSELYIKHHLSKVNINNIYNSDYMNKMFFYYWAFERAGAPQGFKIAAVKTIEHIKKSKRTPSDIFKMYFNGKLNIKNNPLLDKNIRKFDIIPVINEIKIGNLYNAFNMINLNGINHKIKSFFIRDIFYLIGDENLLNNDVENSLYAFPIDIWVRETLNRIIKINSSISIKRKNYGNINKSDFELAFSTISKCHEEGISSLKLNMGIWYYASTFVADLKRLDYLIKSGKKAIIDETKVIIELQKNGA